MIVVENLTKFYGARPALSGLSFSIEDNEVVGFLGRNGAGKTTVLKILSGLLLPTSGAFSVGGVDGLRDPIALRAQVGFLPDRPPLYEDMSPRAMVAYAGRLYGMPKAGLDARVDEVLAQTHLSNVADDRIGWLSHGYRQRVGIAQAVVHRPRFVILDEPISGLDPAQIVEMRKLVKGLAAHHTVLLSSHILSEIAQTCDRILVLHEGRIVARGTEQELMKGLTAGPVHIDVAGGEDTVRGVFGGDGFALSAAGPGRTRVTFEAAHDDAVAAAVKRAVDGGLAVVRVAPDDEGLEGTFLQLTKGAAA